MSESYTLNVKAVVEGKEDVDSLVTDLEKVDTAPPATAEVAVAGADEAATNLGTVADALEKIPVVGPRLAEAATAIGDIVTNAKNAGGEGGPISKLTGLLAGFGAGGLVSAGINLIGDAWGYFADKAEAARQKAQALADAHRDLMDALAEGEVQAAALQFQDLYGDVIAQADKAGIGIESVTQFITGQVNTLPLAAAGYRDLTDAQTAALGQSSAYGGVVSGTTAQLADQARQQLAVNESLEAAQEAASQARISYREQNLELTGQDQLLADVAAGLSGVAAATEEAATTAAENPIEATTSVDDEGFVQGLADLRSGAEEGPAATVPTDADTDPAESDIAAVTDADHPTTIEATAETVAAAQDLIKTALGPYAATIVAKAHTGGAVNELRSILGPYVATIVAQAYTAGAENALNNAARTRTAHINVVSHGGGGGGGGGAAVQSMARGAAPAAAPVVVQTMPSVTINTAVIGSRYAVQRAVARSLESYTRLNGRLRVAS